MNKFKKIIIIVPILLFIGLVIFLTLLAQTQPKKPFVPAPKIPSALKGKFELKLNVSETQFSTPTEAALITIDNQTPLSKEEAQVVAEKLGFSSDPRTANDVFEGTTYIWSNIESTLIAYSKTRKIKYSTNKTGSVINKKLSDEDIIKTAKDFLIKNFYGGVEDFEFSFFTFLKLSPTEPEQLNITSKGSASVYQVNFSPKTGGHKTLTLDPKSSPIYAWVLPDGSISKSSVIKFKDSKTTDNKYKLKSYQEVVDSLGNAVVVSLDDGNINFSDLPEGSIKEIIVNSIDLSYLLDSPTSTFLQPVFTLKGTTRITGFPEEISAFLYLPALSN